MSQEETQNSGSLVLHDQNGKFVKGHPKIGGRERGIRNFTTKVREAIERVAEARGEEAITYEMKLIETILDKAINQKDSQIIKLMWNYFDGMPQQKVHLSEEEITNPYENLTYDQIIEEIRKYVADYDAEKREKENTIKQNNIN